MKKRTVALMVLLGIAATWTALRAQATVTLTAPTVSPNGGLPGIYTFEVVYTDPGNLPPAAPGVQLAVQDTGAGTTVTGSPFTLTQVDPLDTDYTNGALFRATATLPAANLSYQYTASNGGPPATLGPISGLLVNTPPVLTAAGFSPATGSASTSFEFHVTYQDADGHAPSYVEAVVDAGQVVPLSPYGSPAYSAGVLFQGTAVLAPGFHTYYLRANDGQTTGTVVYPFGADINASYRLAGPRNGAVVSGIVTAAGSGTPVSGATVSAAGYTATTAADGRYTLPLPAGTYTLTAQAPIGQNLLDVTAPVTVAVGNELTQSFALPAGGTLSGSVKDSAGAAVSMAVVNVLHLDGRYINSGSTDTNGNYSVTRMPGGNVLVEVTPVVGSNLISRRVLVATIQGQPVTQNVVIAKGATLTCSVKDGSGTAVVNALVTVEGQQGNQSQYTATAGTVVFNGLAAGSYHVWVSPYGNLQQQSLYADLTVGESRTLNFVLTSAGKLSGTVRNGAGIAVSGAQITATNAASGSYLNGYTDGAGQYSITGIGAGTFRVVVNPPYGSGLLQATRSDLQIASGAQVTADFTLIAGGTVSGTVTNAAGTPVSGASIRLYWPTGCLYATSDTSGAYQVTGVPRGNLELEVAPPSGMPLLSRWHDFVSVTPGQTTTRNVRLPAAATVKVTVTSGGTPLAAANVYLSPGSASAATGSDGVVTLGPLEAGSYQVTVIPQTGNGLEETLLTGITVQAGQTLNVAVNVKPGGMVSGRVLDRGGAPIANAFVGLTGAASRTTTTGTDGVFAFASLPQGAYEIAARPPAGAAYLCNAQSFYLDQGQIATKNLTLAPSPVVQGRVTNASGTPVPYAGVSISSSTGYYDTRSTGPDGGYSFAGMPVGVYAIAVSVPSGVMALPATVNGISVTSSSPVVQDVQLEPAGMLTGMVRTPDGQPFTGGGSIVASYVWNYRSLTTPVTLGSDGSYMLSGLPVVPVDLAVYPGGAYRSAQVRGVPIAAGTTTQRDVTLEAFAEPGALSVSVRFEGAAVVGANVGISCAGAPGPIATTTTNSDGIAFFSDLAPGTYSVSAQSPGSVNALGAGLGGIAVSAGATAEVSLLLAKGATVEGTVTDAAGVPVGGASLTLQGTTGTMPSQSVTAGNDGTYRFDRLPAGVYELTTSAPTMPTLAARRLAGITVNAGQVVTQNVQLTTGAMLRGVVTDSTGKVIAGAVVAVVSGSNTRTVGTDRDGLYVVTAVPAGTCRVSACPPGSTNLLNAPERTVAVADGATVQHNIVLAVGSILTGRVTDDASKPVVGASASLSFDGSSYSTLTDDAGVFRFEGLRPGQVNLNLIGPDRLNLAPVRADAIQLTAGGITQFDVAMHAGGTVTGVVSFGGQPVADASVQVSRQSTPVAGGRTDAEGRYTFNRLAPGSYYVSITPPTERDLNAAYQVYLVSIGTGAPTVVRDVALPQEGVLTGIVSAGPGNPVTDGSVRVCDEQGNTRGSAALDANGRFRVGHLASGRYSLSVRPSDAELRNLLQQSYTGISVTAGSETAFDVTVPGGVTLAGNITDAAGNPVPGARVVLLTGGSRVTDVETNPDGSFRLTGVVPGVYSVYAQPPDSLDLAPTLVNNVSILADTTRSLALAPQGVFTTTVTDSAGTPIAGAEVALVSTDHAWNLFTFTASTGTDGRVRIAHLPAGLFDAVVKPPYDYAARGLAAERFSGIRVARGQAVSMARLTLGSSGSITGIVSDPQGNPASGVDVRAKGPSGDSTSTSDSEGRFQVSGLAAGTYWVEAQPNPSTGWLRRSVAGVRVTLGSTTTQNLLLAPGGSLSGRVLDTASAPVAGAWIVLNGTSGVSIPTQTATDGSYRIPGLRAQNYQMAITPSTGNLLDQVVSQIRVGPGEQVTRDVVLQAGGVVSGRVFGTDSVPVTQPMVWLRAQDGSTRTILGGMDGRYRFEGISTGIYDLIAATAAVGGVAPAPAFVPGVGVTTGQTTSRDVTLVPSSSVRVKAVDAAGSPVADAEVAVTVTSPAVFAGARGCGITNSQGETRITVAQWYGSGSGTYGLPAGTYGVQIIPASGSNLLGMASYEINVGIGAESVTTAQLGATAVLTGRVVDGSDAGLDGVEIGLVDADGTPVMSSTHSDSTGLFRIEGVPAGTYALRVLPGERHPLFVSKTVEGVQLTAGAESTQRIVLDRGSVLSGRVMDATAGTPVDGATITLSVDGNTGSRSTQCDSSGKYLLGGLRPGRYHVSAVAPGQRNLAPGTADVTLSLGADSTQDFNLVVGGAIEGTVQDDAGVAVAWAAVQAPGAPSTAYSDASGMFRLEQLAAGTYDLSLIPPTETCYGRQEITGVTVGAGETVRRTFILRQTGELKGHVTTASGQPAAGARVSATGAPTVYTDSSGTYFMGGVPAGPATVTVEPAEGSSLVSTSRTGVSVVARQTTVCDFTLAGAATLMGVVKDSSGVGIENASIKVVLSERGISFRTQADSVGHYVITDIPAGRYDIAAAPPKTRPELLAQAAYNVVLTSGVTATQDLTLGSGGTVAGTVRDGAGNPLSGVVRIYGVGPNSVGAPTLGGFRGEALIGSDGRYTLLGVPSGTFTVAPVVSSSEALISQQVRVTVTAGATVEQSFVLSAGGRISGHVLGPDGAAVEVAVLLRRTGSPASSSRRTQTDATGYFLLAGVPPANDYVVCAEPFGEPSLNVVAQQKPAVVTAGSQTVVDFRLSAGGILRGHVTSSAGQAVAGARLELRGAAEAEWTTGDDGAFQFQGLADGSYDLNVAVPVGVPVIGQIIRGIAVSAAAPVTREIQLAPASRVDGIVRTRSGAPVAGVTVWLFGAGKPVMPTESESVSNTSLSPSAELLAALSKSAGSYAGGTTTGSDGRFAFEGLPAGHFTVVTDEPSDPGLAPSKAEVDLATGGTGSVVVALPQAGAITGVVHGAAGTPLGGVKVMVSGAYSTAETTTDGAGRFDFRGLAPGQQVIKVSAPYGEGSGSKKVTVDLPEGATVTQDISLAATGSIGGVVNRAEGALAGAVVHLYGPDHDSTRTTGADGVFLFESLAAGVFHIEVKPPQGAALNGVKDDLVLSAGQSLQKSLLLPRATGAISGDVTFTGTQTGPVVVALFAARPSSDDLYSEGLSGSSASTSSRSGRRAGTRGWAAIDQTAAGTDSPLFQTRLSAPGAFSLTGVPDGQYHLLAVMDLNGNGQVDPGEPVGKYGRPNAVFVSGGAAVGGIHVTLLVPFASADIGYGRVVPHAAAPGTAVTLSVTAFSADAVRAVVHGAADESVLGTVNLLDDGAHGDGAANDGLYGGTFTVPAAASGDYTVDFAASDAQGNWTAWADCSGFTTSAFQKTARMLLVSVDANLASVRIDSQGNTAVGGSGSFAAPLNGERSIEEYYAGALRANGVSFDIWRTACRGPIDAGVLNQYASADGAVVVAWPHETLAGTPGLDEDAVVRFLDAGGRLFVSGQDIAWEAEASDSYHFSTVMHEYLCAGFVKDSTSYELSGRRGDLLADGMHFRVSGGEGANNQAWTDAIVALPPAQPILHYEESTAAYTRAAASRGRGVQVTYPQPRANRRAGRAYVDPGSGPLCGGLRLDNGRYKVVYLSFGFEAIADSNQRALLLKRSLQFLTSPVSSAARVDASASVSTLPADGVSSATLTANVTNAAGSPVADGTLVSFRGYNASVAASALTTGGSVTIPVVAGKEQGPMTVAVSSGAAATNVVLNGLAAAAGVTEARSLGATAVEVAFDRPMGKATAENPANYTLSPALSVSAAALSSEPNRVVLTTATQMGIPYTVTVGAVLDATGQALGARAAAGFVGTGAAPTIALASDAPKILANGKEPATITATLTGPEGAVVPDGTEVTFATTLGSVSPAKGTTTGGKVTTLLKSVYMGAARVTATCGAARAGVDVEVVDAASAAITLEASPAFLGASGAVSVTLKATVTDVLGRGMSEVPVTFATDFGTLSPTSAQTAAGVATTVISSTSVGTANVTAKTPNGKETTLAVVLPTAESLHNPTATITVTAGAVVLPDDGTGTTELTITLTDAAGNPVPDGFPVALTTTLGSVPASGVVAGGCLRVTFTAGTTAGAATIRTTSGDAAGKVVIYVVGPSEPAFMTLSPTPNTVAADGASTSLVTATVTNVRGEPVADGTAVEFSATGGTLPASATTTGGKAAVAFKAGTEPGTATVIATAGVAKASADITLTSGTTAQGTIAVPAGQTLPTDTVIELRDAGDSVVATGTAQADGSFRLTSDTPGTYDVVVRATGYVPMRKEGVDLTRPGRAVLQELSFTLVPQPGLAAGAGLSMMSVPFEFRSAEIEKVLGDPDTVAYWYNPITKRYQIAGVDGIPPVTVGRGFWIKPQRGGKAYDIVQPARMPAQDQPQTLVLDKGWQLIGSPYATGSVSLSQIQVLLPGSTTPLPFGDPATTNQIRGYLWTWNGSAYDLVSTSPEGRTTTLTPFRGYWVRTLVEGVRLVFSPPTRTAEVAGESTRRRAASAAGWRAHVQASVGGASQGSGCFGVGPSAYSIDAPPSPDGHVDVHFLASGGSRAAVSVVDQDAAEAGWSFEVAGAAEGKDVTLTWPGLGEVPRSTRLVLVEEETGRRWQMRTTPSVTFRSTGAPRRFRVEAQRATGALVAVTGITLSRVRSGGRSIGYTVSSDVNASVSIKSATGRTVCRVMESRAVSRGRNDVYWDGLDDRGVAVNGLVLVEITATDDEGATVRAVQPAMLVR